MTPLFALFTFVNVWFVTFFFVLAFVVKPDPDASAIEYKAAPKALPWKKVIRINSLISLGITLILALLIKSQLVPLHGLFDNSL